MNYDKSQLMRGTLEGCILRIISMKTTYGYEIIEKLQGFGFQEIAEGTIYPLLMRLEKQGNIIAELRPSPLGPKRKYFSITADGKEYLNQFERYWSKYSDCVNRILAEDGE